jgi:membrane carboxypeptidase/penicillin-binding protein PbpC
VRSRRVCALSGLVPGPWCPETRSGEFLAGVSPDSPCALHGPGADGRAEVRWPAEVAVWMDREGPKPGAAAPVPEIAIRVPEPGATYVLGPEPGGEILHLSAAAAPGAGRLYWLLDGALLTRSSPGRSAPWRMTAGHHRLTAADERGASASVEFDVLEAR